MTQTPGGFHQPSNPSTPGVGWVGLVGEDLETEGFSKIAAEGDIFLSWNAFFLVQKFIS